MTRAERDHIGAIGRRLFMLLEAEAYFCAKQDACLCAAEKTRFEIAHEAALRATGFPDQHSVPKPSKDREVTADFQGIVDEVMTRAVEAVRAAAARLPA